MSCPSIPGPRPGSRADVVAQYLRLLDERRSAARRGEDTTDLDARLREFMWANRLGEEPVLDEDGNP